MPPDAHLTIPLVWICTGILVLMDSAHILVARRTIQRNQFGHMRRLLGIAGGVFFLLVWTGVMLWGWEWFYSYIFSGWARYMLPPIFGLSYTLLALGMAWLSLKLPGSPAVTWCVLGGVEGLLSHIVAIYGLGAASNPPIMHGVSQFSVLVFAIFEKAFYWSIILLACGQLSQIYHRSRIIKRGETLEKLA